MLEVRIRVKPNPINSESSESRKRHAKVLLNKNFHYIHDKAVFFNIEGANVLQSNNKGCPKVPQVFLTHVTA